MRIKRAQMSGWPKCMELLWKLSRNRAEISPRNVPYRVKSDSILERSNLFAPAVPGLIIQPRVPVLAASFGRGVEDGPQRIHVGRTARILAGIGRRRSHFAGPEMADGSVVAREHGIARRVGIRGTDVIARVVARGVGVDPVPRPATRLLCRD